MSFHSISARHEPLAQWRVRRLAFAKGVEAVEGHLELKGVEEARRVVEHLHIGHLHNSHIPAKTKCWAAISLPNEGGTILARQLNNAE
jgi:hypothetical protein